jgi:hypothetical protein
VEILNDAVDDVTAHDVLGYLEPEDEEYQGVGRSPENAHVHDEELEKHE